jgi:hypothetical protein
MEDDWARTCWATTLLAGVDVCIGFGSGVAVDTARVVEAVGVGVAELPVPAGALVSEVGDAVDDAVGDGVSDEVGDEVGDKVGDKVGVADTDSVIVTATVGVTGAVAAGGMGTAVLLGPVGDGGV